MNVRRRWSILTLLVLALAVALLVLRADLPHRHLPFEDLSLWLRIRNHKTLVVVALATVACGTLMMLFILRASRLFAAVGVATVLAGAALGALLFQLQYPLVNPFEASRYRDMLAIFLGKDAALSRFEPQPTLIVEHKSIVKARFPVIDIHFHFESLPLTISPARLVQAMDAVGVSQVVNLGGVEGMFEHFDETFRRRYPDRFVLFVKPDPGALEKPHGVQHELDWMRRAARMGARGVKENKSFGLQQLDGSGAVVALDDPRLSPYWELAAQLGMPVLIHSGEPPSFWAPVDATNERYEELLENPAWSLHDKPVPSREALMAQRERLIAAHPHTNFIGAHLGMNPNDLAYVARMLDRFPNYYVDMSSVVSELGRQPNAARAFFIKYQDRILFGTDGGYGLHPDSDWTPERMYRAYFEFLETDNDYIEYPLQSITKQGTWRVYGLHLPDEVLEKVYFRNAKRLLPSTERVEAGLVGPGTPHPVRGSSS